MKSKKKEIKFTYIAPRIFGSPSNWGYSFEIGTDYFKTLKQAIKAGLKYFCHDDFFIGEFEGGKCIAAHIENKGIFKEDSDDFGEYVKGVNRELGV